MSGGLFQKGKLQGGWMCVWAVSRQSKWNLKNLRFTFHSEQLYYMFALE